MRNWAPPSETKIKEKLLPSKDTVKLRVKQQMTVQKKKDERH